MTRHERGACLYKLLADYSHWLDRTARHTPVPFQAPSEGIAAASSTAVLTVVPRCKQSPEAAM